MNKRLLNRLYSIHSPSGKEENMRNFLTAYICGAVRGCEIEEDLVGNIYVTKGNAENYPCVVAHIDQVQDKHSKDFTPVYSRGIIYGYSFQNKRFEGLGADDKNGVYIALECLRGFPQIKVAFFVGEEIGCVGSSDANMRFFDDCRFVLQCDRKGSSDLITEISCGLCSEEFLKDVQCKDFGYSPTHGLMTDVDTLKQNGLAVSCVNMSCGYYAPHTDNEFVIISELENTLNFCRSIIKRCTKVYPHEAEFAFGRHSGGFGKYSKYSYWYGYTFEDEVSDMLWDNPNLTVSELKEALKKDYPNKTDKDFRRAYDTHFETYGKYLNEDYLDEL